MANEEHLRVLLEGTEAWNLWRQRSLEESPNLNSANFRGANLKGVNLSSTNLSSTNFSSADLSNADLRYAEISSADLNGADLSSANLISAQVFRSNLSNADLSSADLRSADLMSTDLRGANLSNANLISADLRSANLRGTNLRGADLRGANLGNANLSDANLGNANLSDANLSDANLRDAFLYAAQVLGCDFLGATLTGACIEYWQIGRLTKLNSVRCDYIFRQVNEKNKFTQRLPVDPNAIFAPGEFERWASVRAAALATIDLTFTEGIDWQSLFSTLQQVRHQHPESGVRMQSVEENNGSYVVRLRVETEVTGDALERLKAEIETQTKLLYEQQLIEARTEIRVLDRNLDKALEKLAMASNTYNNNIQGNVGSIGGDNYGAMNAYIGANTEEIARLLTALREQAQVFPQKQKEQVLDELDDLEKDLKSPEPPDRNKLGRRLKRLMATGTAVVGLTAGAATVADNVNQFTDHLTELGEKLGAIEFVQPQQPDSLPSG